MPGDGLHSVAAQCMDNKHVAVQHIDGFLLFG